MKQLLLLTSLAVCFSCSDDNNLIVQEYVPTDDASFVGKAVGNFSKEEWFPGGELGTSDDVSPSSYEAPTPATDNQGLTQNFKNGETFFERNFNISTAPFSGLGPAWVRQSCIACHPGYGHGKRQTIYRANDYGNGYLLVVYHPTAGTDALGNSYAANSYVTEVTGMPQTKAAEPFLPPIDESGIHISWPEAAEGALPFTFPDGETYSLIYPVVTIDPEAFHTSPVPTNYECRIESTIGIYGSGLLDAITEDDLREQYRAAAPYCELNPAMWDKTANDFAASAWYTLADGTKAVKRFTYALTRASLQDGAGANAIWNITNVTRSDRHKLYTTDAWARAMSETPSVINAILADPTSPYRGDGTREGAAQAVKTLLSPTTDQTNNLFHNFAEEMKDRDYYDFMVWHRGLAVPRARNLQSEEVQRGKQLFEEMGCATCHRPSWTTGEDNYWAPENIKAQGALPKYPRQVIYPYTDMLQHRLFMLNDIRTGWCRTTPLWGRGLSLQNTGADDRLHDCRARNVIEAIMWHGYSRESDAFSTTQKFYNLPKADRDAVVAFINAI